MVSACNSRGEVELDKFHGTRRDSVCNQSAKVGPRSAVPRGVQGRETKTGGRRQKTTKKRPARRGQGRKKGPTGRRGCTCHIVARPYKADDPEETRGEGATNNARVSP